MGDMIDRDAAIAKCRAIADEAKSYGMPQMAMGGYASAEAIRALPAADARDTRPVHAQPVRYCPICDIADCAAHRPAALEPVPVLVTDGVLSNDEIAAIIEEGPGRIVQAAPAPAPDLAELVEAATAQTAAMTAFWEADEAAAHAERYGCTEDQVWLTDEQIKAMRQTATDLWQSIPALTEAIAAALAKIKEQTK